MTKKARIVMVMQDLNHLKIDINEFPKILAKLGADKWCYIVHNKDKNENGEKIRDHVHVLIKLKNPRSLNNIAKSFKVEPQYVEIWNGIGRNSFNNGLSYLIHETTNAIAKHHYSDNEVIASFDFHKEMTLIRKQIKSSTNNGNVKDLIQKYGTGIISLAQLEDMIGIYETAKNKTLIENMTKLLEQKEYKKWEQEFNGKCKTFYFYGETGIGKTEIATQILKELKRITGEPYKILGSTRDPFEYYRSEKFILLDDLRPNVLDYSSMLKLFDPRPFGKIMPSRYSDKQNVRTEIILITGPYSLKQFYYETKILDRKIDNFNQLKRRIIEIHFTKKVVEKFQNERPQFNTINDLLKYLEKFGIS